MGPLICTSLQHCSRVQQTWVGTDMEDVEENILTGNKQWFDSVWTFFCNISILKKIVFCRFMCLFDFIFVPAIWKQFSEEFLLFCVLGQAV